MTDLTAAPPVFFPTPDHFPVAWQNPGDARLTWALDRMHWPAPVNPLSGDLIALFLKSSERVTRRFGLPERSRARRVNTYIYLAQEPLDLTPAEMDAVQPQAEAYTAAALADLHREWQERCLPQISASLDYWENFDLADAPGTELLAHLDETLNRVDALAEMHHNITCLAELSTSLFCDLYDDLPGEKSPTGGGANLDAFGLLQGIDQGTLQMSRDLWALGRLALRIPILQKILAEQPPESALALLRDCPPAAPFLGEMQAFLNNHGMRSSGPPIDLEPPSWRENPAAVIRILKEYLEQPDRNPRAELDRQAARRERLQTETLRRLEQYPPTVREQFLARLKAAQAGVFISEEHHYWLDCLLTYQVRRVALAFGQRLQRAGVLASPDDVFYLTFSEIRQAADTLPPGERDGLGAPEHTGTSWQNTVSGRRAEMAYFRTVEPPPALGIIPAQAQPPAVAASCGLSTSARDAFVRADTRFWGAPPQPSHNQQVLRGSPGAAGVVRGQARVMRSLHESGSLQKGEILVVEMTFASWTRLFSLAAAVVTDTGGVLCHTATVAREYGIPAVVGTQTGTQVIRTGQMLEVNGAEGVVRLLSDDE